MPPEPIAERTSLPSARESSGQKDHNVVGRSISLCLILSVVWLPSTAESVGKHPVTVSDVVNATRVAGPADSSSFLGGSPTRGFASFSPNRKWCSVVLRRANISNNTNTYSLFVIEIDAVFRGVRPKLLVVLSSSSNREGIKQVTWLDDNETILFLGEHPDESTQLYKVSRKTSKLSRLTSHPTSLTSYSVSSDGHRIVYAAEPHLNRLKTPEVLRNSIYVPRDADLAGLLSERVTRGSADGCELFVTSTSNRPRPLKVTGSLLFPAPQLSISPDGRYAVVMTLIRNPDTSWKDYEDAGLKRALSGLTMATNAVRLIRGYEIVDLGDGSSQPLIDAPIGDSGSDIIWSANSRSVIVTGIHLPLNSKDPEVLRDRHIHTFVVEVSIPDVKINQISDQDLRLLGFDRDADAWKFEARQSEPASDGRPTFIYYRKTIKGWVSSQERPVTTVRPRVDIFVDENKIGLQVIAEDLERNRNVVLFDLNPQFRRLSLGTVEDLTWKDVKGNAIMGALYRPPNFVSGKRYPLVVQTHGYRPHASWIDGPFATAFAAQPLASKSIVVLQLPELAAGTPEEGERNLLAIESGVEHLNQMGVIDIQRVGLIGFSRTSFHVKYVLTHSKFHFAAAAVADGVDAGYFQFMVFANEAPNVASDAVMLVGARPFGKGLQSWIATSPGFLLDKVESPLLIQATRPGSLLGEWEWFSGLSQLGKPVDLLYIPTGEHVLEKPWDRVASLQATVDWFNFWLNGQEDVDPAKMQQFERWRSMRRALEMK
jgi:dipeptidyl aminopeptidase/acylaminoacyl peptidase